MQSSPRGPLGDESLARPLTGGISERRGSSEAAARLPGGACVTSRGGKSRCEVSSPPVAPLRACADGPGRMRILRARKVPVGLLVLVASFLSLHPRPLAAQFPIRQLPPRVFPAAQPAAAAPRANPLPGQAAPTQPAQTPHPAICRITVPEKGAVSFGSGTLVDSRGQFGLVVTNWHVVRDNAGGPITVEFPGGFKSPAEVVKTDRDWDLAALSIARPPAAPLPITPAVPQRGEWLTIAGYGSGDYRAATGSLANYVSPSPDLPTEMLDIAQVEARQGDSGGPILNQRGELCGVLFGAARGYTNGSHGGRVLNFLASVVPGGTPGGDAPPTTALAEAPKPSPAPQPQPSHADPFLTAEADLAAVAPPPNKVPLDIPLLAPPPPRDGVAESSAPAPFPSSPPPPSARVAPAVAAEPAALIHTALPPRVATGETAANLHTAPTGELAAAIWKQVGGTTAADQGKTILAIIGVLSLLIFGWRITSRGEPEVEED